MGADCEYTKQKSIAKKFGEIQFCSSSTKKIIVCCPLINIEKRKSEKYCDIIKSQPATMMIPGVLNQILNGLPASKREFPFMVALGYEQNNQIEYLCGGALLSRTWVLSAAHCSKREIKKVRVGTVSIKDFHHLNLIFTFIF